MLARFNQNMYDHIRALKSPKSAAGAVSASAIESGGEDDENEEMIEILNDVEELLGEPVFLVE